MLNYQCLDSFIFEINAIDILIYNFYNKFRIFILN